MTPMVDLGFLLITFFVITAELSQPVTTPLNMPADGPPMPLGESSALTVLLSGTSVYYYEGNWEDALRAGNIYTTTMSSANGLGKVIREKQQELEDARVDTLGRDGLMLVFKAGPETPYRQLVDALDETTINQVKRHALVAISKAELDYISSK